MLAMSFLELITDDIFGTFTDSTVYFTMAMIGTLFFLIRMGLMMLGGADAGDFDVDTSDGVDGHGGDFTFFSLLSILSFLMGAGWMGLAARREWGWGSVEAALAASGFGFFLMTVSSTGLYFMRRLESSGQYDVKSSVGKIGRVYLKVPPKGQGRGQIEITVDGRRKVLPAVSSSVELASFTAARVVGVQEDETLILEPESGAPSAPASPDAPASPSAPAPETATPDSD